MTAQGGHIPAERLRPGSPTVQWPPVPDLAGALTLGLLKQVEKANTLPADAVATLQLEQLMWLTEFAHKSTQYYRRVLGQVSGGKVNRSDFRSFWHAIPTVSIADLKKNRLQFAANAVPKQYGAVTTLRSVMPDGVTVRLKSTPVPNLIEKAVQIAMMRAYGWDFGGKLAMSGPAKTASVRNVHHWGLPIKTGQMMQMSAGASMADWLERLDAFRPDYLVLPAAEIVQLRSALDSADRAHGLKEALIVGSTAHRIADLETVTIRRLVTIPGIGAIAAEQPEGRGYWLQPTATLCELLDAEGGPVPPGAAGRLVVTPLHNFAMPILRLDLGITATRTSDADAPGPATIAFS